MGVDLIQPEGRELNLSSKDCVGWSTAFTMTFNIVTTAFMDQQPQVCRPVDSGIIDKQSTAYYGSSSEFLVLLPNKLSSYI